MTLKTTSKDTKIGRIINLGSSSDGNSFYIEIYRKGYPNPFKLLIECGFEYTYIQSKLLEHNISVNDLNAILITHEHLDHARSIVNFYKKGKKIYAPQSVFDKHGLGEVVDKSKYVITAKIRKGIADGIDVLGMELDHENDDGSKTYNLGYIITVDNDYKILFITDTKHIKWNLRKYKFSLIFIEANNMYSVMTHALKNAQEHHETGKIIHFKRVLKSHMLVEKTAKTLCEFDLSKCELIILTHLSTNSNLNKFRFKEIIEHKLDEYKKFRTVKITKKGKSTIMRKPMIRVATRYGSIE
jgi:phosphoribosyl 1,2-cyclic phosphodiesterase